TTTDMYTLSLHDALPIFEGPSTSKAKCIDIISFSWGVSQTSTYGAGASGKEAKAGRADFSNLTITKVLDKTSALLADHCASGDRSEEHKTELHSRDNVVC